MRKLRNLQIVPFLGPRVVGYLTLSFVVGLVLFGVEIGFSYALQAFLLLLGITNRSALGLPRWLPELSMGPVLVIIFCMAILRSLLVWGQNFMRNSSAEEFNYLQRLRILDWTFLKQATSTSRTMNLFNELSTQAGHAIRYIQTVVTLSTTSLFLALGLLYLAPGISLCAGLVLLALAAPLRSMNRRIRESGRGLVSEWERTHDRLLLSVKNLLLLRIYGLERLEKDKTQAGLRLYLNHHLTFQRTVGAYTVIPQALGVTLICLIIFFARSRTSMTGGMLLAYFYLFIRFLQNSALVGQASGAMVFQWPHLRKMYDWWTAEIRDTDLGRAQAAPAASGSPLTVAVGWKFHDVSFRYPGGEEDVIHKLALDAPAGQALVILGPSGAGKSTLLALLVGELVPGSGSIDLSWDGQVAPLAEMKSRLLPSIGYVGAESFLIEGTIRQNLMYGIHSQPGEAELDDAIRKAECQFIFELPKGLEHRLTDQGQGLSSGQKQRLALARALLRRPKALILDEATANLDVATEEKLVATFAQLKGQMTIVAVTHRQALLKIADQVLKL